MLATRSVIVNEIVQLHNLAWLQNLTKRDQHIDAMKDGIVIAIVSNHACFWWKRVSVMFYTDTLVKWVQTDDDPLPDRSLECSSCCPLKFGHTLELFIKSLNLSYHLWLSLFALDSSFQTIVEVDHKSNVYCHSCQRSLCHKPTDHLARVEVQHTIKQLT